MGKWDDYPLVADISHYNVDVDIDLLKEKGVACIIAKASDGYLIRPGTNYYKLSHHVDPWFARNCDKAYQAGLPFGAYHYFQTDHAIVQSPTKDTDRQYLAFQYALRNKTFHFIMIDLEDADDSNSNISRKVRQFMNWCAEDYDVPITLYTSIGFLTSKAPDIINWCGSQSDPVDMHMAQWIWHQKAATWETLKSFILGMGKKYTHQDLLIGDFGSGAHSRD